MKHRKIHAEGNGMATFMIHDFMILVHGSCFFCEKNEELPRICGKFQFFTFRSSGNQTWHAGQSPIDVDDLPPTKMSPWWIFAMFDQRVRLNQSLDVPNSHWLVDEKRGLC